MHQSHPTQAQTLLAPSALRASRLALRALLFAAFAVVVLHAQSTPPAPPAPPTVRSLPAPVVDEAVQLSPFEVKTEKDTSYGALNSNSITRFNTELDKVPVSADIFTEEFMNDIAATSVEQMLLEYGAGMGLSSSAADSDAEFNQPGDRVGNQQLGARGMAAGYVKMDGFSSSGTMTGDTSTFATERVEVLQGPQGLLYGAGGAGGTINAGSKRARFNNRGGRLMFRTDRYGSKQSEVDYNWGRDWFAYRISLVDTQQRYRRVFIGHRTQGLYVQLAFRLPLRSTLRLQAQLTQNDRVNPTSVNSINFASTARDPRHNYSLTYLLATGRAGAVDPDTGQPYPLGAIARGGLTWDNVNSWAGSRSAEYYNTNTWTANLDTVWAKWLSSQFAVRYNDAKTNRIFTGFSGLSSAPLNTPTGIVRFNGNPLDDWANGAVLRDIEQPTRRLALRGNLLLDNSLFGKRARSQTGLGYDAEWWGQGPVDYRYYLADENWNVIYGPGTNLGRTELGTQWWTVGSSPVEHVFAQPGWKSPRVMFNGQRYVRSEQNPRDQSWVSANNPLGLASLAGFSGISGQNNRGHPQENRSIGYYLTNYTGWFNDRFGTLFGIRTTETFKRNPNTSTSETRGYTEGEKSNESYNAGINYGITSWLRAYYSLSSTYNTPLANANDPIGNEPRTSSATGHEIGLKFSPRGGAISGSLEYYWTSSKDEMINAGTGTRDLINPDGLNGSHLGPAGAKNQWVNLDRKTSGIGLILTAAPVRNWRVRATATLSDGQTETNKSYPLLYNDQFYLNAAGNVTYANGTPFLVPIDQPTIAARITGLNRQTDPSTLQGTGTWVPLTRAMISDPANPYWANPAPNNGRIQTGNLRRVLQYFVSAGQSALTGLTGLPLSDIQYAWSDPTNSGGRTIVARQGEKTVGYAKYRFSLTNTYTFTTDNWLRGLTVGSTVAGGFGNRTYYYSSPDGIRRLFSSPDLVQVNLMTSYRYKIFKRYTLTTQLNISNLLNHYKVGLLPSATSGFALPTEINATFYQQPRTWTWTNTIAF